MAFNGFLFISSLIVLPLVASASGYGYTTPSGEYSEKKNLPTIYGIQGLVYCRSSYHLNPLQGATAQISCMKKGYKGLSKISPKTDSNGYFLALITPEELGKGLEPSDCKVVLHSSPSSTCNVPTDVDMGVSGATPAHSRVVAGFMSSYNMELYSVSPFVYTSSTKGY